jgi:hypothetical protein
MVTAMLPHKGLIHKLAEGALPNTGHRFNIWLGSDPETNSLRMILDGTVRYRGRITRSGFLCRRCYDFGEVQTESTAEPRTNC